MNDNPLNLMSATTGDIIRFLDRNAEGLVEGYRRWISNRSLYQYAYQPDWAYRWRQSKTREFEHHLRNMCDMAKELP
jgi:hypothetical protein